MRKLLRWYCIAFIAIFILFKVLRKDYTQIMESAKKSLISYSTIPALVDKNQLYGVFPSFYSLYPSFSKISAEEVTPIGDTSKDQWSEGADDCAYSNSSDLRYGVLKCIIALESVNTRRHALNRTMLAINVSVRKSQKFAEPLELIFDGSALPFNIKEFTVIGSETGNFENIQTVSNIDSTSSG